MSESAPAAELALIAALAEERAIGRAGTLPWHVPEDLKRFRAITTGHAVIMGRKTFESIGRALPKRLNIVISRGRPALPEGVLAAASLGEALEIGRQHQQRPIVIGGGEIYREALPLASTLHLTLIAQKIPDADTFFPAYEPAFEITAEDPAETPGVRFLTLTRRSV